MPADSRIRFNALQDQHRSMIECFRRRGINISVWVFDTSQSEMTIKAAGWARKQQWFAEKTVSMVRICLGESEWNCIADEFNEEAERQWYKKFGAGKS